MSRADNPDTIRPGSRVRMHYRILLEDGTLAEDSDAEALEIVIGDDSLPKAIQQSLLGMQAGDTGSFEFAAFEAWGTGDAELRRTLPLEDFGATPPVEDQLIEFALPDGRSLTGTVRRVGPSDVDVDFNHPLYDRNIRVDVRILAVDGPD